MSGARTFYFNDENILKELLDQKLKLVKCEIANKICPLIASHMGQWTTPFKNKKTGKWNTSTGKYIELPKPSTKVQAFVHQADYLASRKMLEFNFDAKE